MKSASRDYISYVYDMCHFVLQTSGY